MECQWNIKLQSSYYIYEHDHWNWNVLNIQGFSLFNVLFRTDIGRSYFLVIKMSLTIASSAHEWMSGFKFICLYSITVWFLPSLTNVSVFRGYRKRPVAWNGLIVVQIFNRSFSKDYQFIKKTSNFVSSFLSW